jgi:uncharacterized membrane protein YkvA (DUF1232 family)
VGQLDDAIIVAELVTLALRLIPKDLLTECRGLDAQRPSQAEARTRDNGFPR